MAIPKTAGHNKNGKEIYKMNLDGSYILDSKVNKIFDDELPIVAKNFQTFLKQENRLENTNYLGFSIHQNKINDYVFIPEYYNPEIEQELNELQSSGAYKLVLIRDLIEAKVLQVRRGNEIGINFTVQGPFRSCEQLMS